MNKKMYYVSVLIISFILLNNISIFAYARDSEIDEDENKYGCSTIHALNATRYVEVKVKNGIGGVTGVTIRLYSGYPPDDWRYIWEGETDNRGMWSTFTCAGAKLKVTAESDLGTLEHVITERDVKKVDSDGIHYKVTLNYNPLFKNIMIKQINFGEILSRFLDNSINFFIFKS